MDVEARNGSGSKPNEKAHSLNQQIMLTTRTGFKFLVRPARPGDEAALADFFSRVSKEDLRFRFLSAVQTVSDEALAMMTSVDHQSSETLLALEPDQGAIIATAMVAANAVDESAEVALSVLPGYKRRGISWALLEHLMEWARSRDMRTLESLESREHHAAIALEREMGFKGEEDPGDSTLIRLKADLSSERQ